MTVMATAAGLGLGTDWRTALDDALAGRAPGPCDLAVVFASYHHREAYDDILAAVAEELTPGVVTGCSGQGVIATGREIEGDPAMSVLSLSLPGATLHPRHLRYEELPAPSDAGAWRALMGEPDGAVNAWIVFADPYTFDADRLVEGLGAAYPGVPVVGGLASAAPGARGSQLFAGTRVHTSGAVVLALGGAWTVRTVVSQGAEPIGQTWTITAADQNLVHTIGGRKALEVLVETVRGLPGEMQQRAARNLLVGLAMDEYRDEFRRGDFLIRNLLGADQERGSIAVGALVRPGQTLQFQVRDDVAADDELRAMLQRASVDLVDADIAGALLCSCNGRGQGLFRTPDHDAAAIADQFEGLAVAGFFCNGEIGPVGDRSFVHGFTASISFFVPAAM
jgi:small ligand-binding sensory domain FIST